MENVKNVVKEILNDFFSVSEDRVVSVDEDDTEILADAITQVLKNKNLLKEG